MQNFVGNSNLGITRPLDEVWQSKKSKTPCKMEFFDKIFHVWFKKYMYRSV